MSIWLRGLAWSAVFVILTVFPGAVAVFVDPFEAPRPWLIEISVALGFFAVPLVFLQFALVSHLRASSRPFGTDALVQFHQYIGLMALAIVVVHPLLLNVSGLPWHAWNPLGGGTTGTGALATIVIAALAFTTAWRSKLGLTYEWWRRFHLTLAVTAAAVIVLHITAVRGYARAPVLWWLCVGYAALFGSATLDYRVVRPWKLARRPWTIVDNRDDGASTRTLRVRPVGHDGFDFEPGQFAWLITGPSPWSSQHHPLSISSSASRPPDGAIEFSIKALGDWSSRVVPELRAGATVWIDGPFGAFTPDRRPAQGFVLIAGGIGIAPLRSMLWTMRDRGDRRHVVLFYAAHDESRLAFTEEIQTLRGSLALNVIYVLDEPRGSVVSERGPMTDDMLKRHLPPEFQRYSFFVCGPPGMMNAVERMLTGLGVRRGAIDTERFTVV